MPERRRNKNDKRAKSRFNKYKVGGALRAANVSYTEKDRSKK